jgi:hypothetical protein
MRRLLLIALLPACTGAPADTDPKDTDAIDTEQTTESDSEFESDVPESGSTLTGTLTTEGGAALTDDVRVQFCRNTACRQASVEAGVYTLNGIDGGPGSFEVVPLEEGSELITVFLPITVEDQGSRTLDVVVPEVDLAEPLPGVAAALNVADGLSVTVSASQLTAPSPFDPAPTELAGTVATSFAPPTEGLTGTVHAVYYLEPFNYEASAPLTVTIRNDFGLTDGQAELYAAVYATYSWEKVGDLIDDGAGGLILADDGGIELITTLAVVQKP